MLLVQDPGMCRGNLPASLLSRGSLPPQAPAGLAPAGAGRAWGRAAQGAGGAPGAAVLRVRSEGVSGVLARPVCATEGCQFAFTSCNITPAKRVSGIFWKHRRRERGRSYILYFFDSLYIYIQEDGYFVGEASILHARVMYSR